MKPFKYLHHVMLFDHPPSLNHCPGAPEEWTIHSCTITGEPANLAMQLVLILCAAKNVTYVLPSVPSLNLLNNQVKSLTSKCSGNPLAHLCNEP